jgi:hypothetical protein
MDRKDFIKKMAGSVLFAIPVISVLGCSDSSSSSSPPNGNPENDCLKNGTNSVINSNHGHTIVVSKADVDSGMSKEYDIAGSSGHDHRVTISASSFDKLKSNQSIQVISSNNDGHMHSINISCA